MRIAFAPTPEDTETIRNILTANPALRGKTSAAIRVALVAWESLHNWMNAETREQMNEPPPDPERA